MTVFAELRRNMVETQVRPSDVTDRRILRAMLEVPRELFVPEALRPLAYMDGAIRLRAPVLHNADRFIMEPRLFSRLVELARIEPGDRVLDVGTVSGYSSAILSKLCAAVVALDCDSELVANAVKLLADMGAANVKTVKGDLGSGWAEDAPYDVIIVEGAIPAPSNGLLGQLKDGGRLVAVDCAAGVGKATVWTRYGDGFDRRVAFDASAPPLPGFERARAFQL